ncbi:hypothetical protein B7486_12935 [cyanobacterium TDX16]|nr:hypothetical protein B7486_12935 [cyanobacterium TDX16]
MTVTDFIALAVEYALEAERTRNTLMDDAELLGPHVFAVDLSEIIAPRMVHDIECGAGRFGKCDTAELHTVERYGRNLAKDGFATVSRDGELMVPASVALELTRLGKDFGAPVAEAIRYIEPSTKGSRRTKATA